MFGKEKIGYNTENKLLYQALFHKIKRQRQQIGSRRISIKSQDFQHALLTPVQVESVGAVVKSPNVAKEWSRNIRKAQDLLTYDCDQMIFLNYLKAK